MAETEGKRRAAQRALHIGKTSGLSCHVETYFQHFTNF